MRQRKLVRMLASVSAVALLATACGGDDDPADDPAEDTEAPADGEETDGEDTEAPDDGEAASGGSFSMYIGEPETLMPMNSTESEGSQVLDAVFRGLVAYDNETAEPLWGDESEDAVAESIESDDNINWTITIKEGWTFHDGTPVTAQSFADAWNYAAYGPNAMNGNYFMDIFEGYDALNEEEPTAEELSGVTVVDDQTLEVTLTGAYSNFPLRLGYTVYYPVPESFLEDPDAFNEQPIGNGPYMLSEPWAHDQYIQVEKYEDYAGTPGNADSVEFRIYAEIETAYNDLQAGNVDIMDALPPEQLTAARDTFGDRFIERESSSFTFIGMPVYLPELEDPRVRQAFSMAIDREAIISAIFNDTFQPADAMVSPVVNGYREGACGELCQFDPEAAAALLEEAGGWEGPLTLMFNSGAGHDQWMEAVANQLRDNLGIEDISFSSLDFAEYLPLLDNKEAEGPFRLGWLMDYPSPENYLAPLHGCNGSSNNSGYCNEEVDSLITQGNEAEDVEAGNEFYQQAEDIIIQDMPIIPMWFGLVQGAYSENVDNVVIDAFAKVDIAGVTVNG